MCGFFESDAQAKMLGREVILHAVRKLCLKTLIFIYKSVFLYVHQKRDAFSLSVYLRSNQGTTPSLPNFVTYPLCFLTACEMMSRPSILA